MGRENVGGDPRAGRFWESGRRELNPPHSAWKADALQKQLAE